MDLLTALKKIHEHVTVVMTTMETFRVTRVWMDESSPVALRFDYKCPDGSHAHLETIPVGLIIRTVEENPAEPNFYIKFLAGSHGHWPQIFAVSKESLLAFLENEGHLGIFEREDDTVECSNCGSTFFHRNTVTVDPSGSRMCKPCAERMEKAEICPGCGREIEADIDSRTCDTCKEKFCKHCVEHCTDCGNTQCDECYENTHGHRRGFDYCDQCREEFAQHDLIREDGQYLCPSCYEAKEEWKDS